MIEFANINIKIKQEKHHHNNELLKLGNVLMQVVLFVGQLSTNVACVGECYQPRVPEKMLKSK